MINAQKFLNDFKEILLEEESITLKSNFKQLKSYDSLFVLEIIQLFDEKYGINLDISVINESNSFQDLYDKAFNVN
jgi:acyl carrier protein